MSSKIPTFTNPAISDEIMRLHGIVVRPGYVGQIRRNYLAATETRPLVEEAIASLTAKARAERKGRKNGKAPAKKATP